MIFEVKFTETRDPWGTKIEVIYLHGPFVAQYNVTNSDWMQPTVFFGECRKMLTAMARQLADMQKNLAKADQRDCEMAMNKFAKGGYSVGTFRTISSATAELVHGIEVKTKDKSVSVSLEPFDIVAGKANKYGLTWLEMDDYKVDFMLTDPDNPANTPGTKLILSSLQEAAREIESFWMSRNPNVPPQASIAAASIKTNVVDEPNANPYFGAQFQFPEPSKGLMQVVPSQFNTNKQFGKENAAKIIEQQLIDSIKGNSAIILPNQSSTQVSSWKVDTGSVKFPDDFSRTKRPLGNPWDDVYKGRSDMVGQDLHVVYKTPSGHCIVPLKDANIEVHNEHNFITGARGQHIKITGGSFSTTDGTVFEGELPVSGSARSKNAKNPSFWAHAAEDRLNGIKQQVLQNLPEGDDTRTLICAISDLLSDHIHAMGSEV